MDRFVTETRSQFQSALRRTQVYLGIDATEDNSTIQSVTFQYLKRKLGNYLQQFIFSMVLLFLFLVAWVGKAHEKIHTHTPLQRPSHSLPLRDVINPVTVSSNATSHALFPNNNGTMVHQFQGRGDSGAGILYVMLTVSLWMCMLTMIKRWRMHAMSMANGDTNSRDIRSLAQFVYANRATMPGLANRLRMAMLQRDFTGDDYEMLQLLDSDEVNRLSGVIQRGASEAVINSFPTRKVSPADARQQELLGDNASQCNICLGPYVLNEELRTLPCRHCFHKECIDPWLRTNAICPVCKVSVNSRNTSNPAQESLGDDSV